MSQRRIVGALAQLSQRSLPMKDLRGKVVVITGASSGLGRATAQRFAATGAIVVASARRQHALEETVRLCKEAGGTAHHCVADVTVEEDLGIRSLTEAETLQH